MSLFTLLKGFSASGSLIIAIGAQNAFVIRQGLKRQHLLLTALACSLIDAFLIFLGVAGFGHFISLYPFFLVLMKGLAIIFLFCYGIISFRSAFKNSSLRCSIEERESSKKKTLFSLLALSFLNPHVYLDTVILLGSIASQHPSHERLYFAFGAISASFAWFFTLTFGARILAPLLQKENSWRVIDCIVAFTMWMIAFTLLVQL